MAIDSSYLIQVLDEWPSGKLLNYDNLIALYPHLVEFSKLEEWVTIENYIRSLETGDKNASKYLENVESSSLLRRLENITNLNVPDVDDGDNFPKVGEKIASYLLIEFLGKGAFSRVFLAADTSAGHRRVVVKVSKGGTREANFLGILNHPSIPKLLCCDIIAESNLSLICMEYVPGKPLCDIISNGHPNSPRQIESVLQIIVQVLDALDVVHSKGVLHCDIKPANILIDDESRAHLIDFNLCLLIAESGMTGFRGTSAYAPPEVVEAARSRQLTHDCVGIAVDIYSVGVVLYEMLTGALPQSTSSNSFNNGIRYNEQSFQSESVRAEGHPISPALHEIVSKAISPCPSDRYQSAEEFKLAILQYQKPKRSFSRFLTISICTSFTCIGVIFSNGAADSLSDSFTYRGGGSSNKDRSTDVTLTTDAGLIMASDLILKNELEDAVNLLNKRADFSSVELRAFAHLALGETVAPRRIVKRFQDRYPMDNRICFIGALAELVHSDRVGVALELNYFQKLILLSSSEDKIAKIGTLIAYERLLDREPIYEDYARASGMDVDESLSHISGNTNIDELKGFIRNFIVSENQENLNHATSAIETANRMIQTAKSNSEKSEAW